MGAACRILCDSTCDLSFSRACDLDLEVIPFHYAEQNPGGLGGDDDLFQSISAHEFYDALRAGATPLTSQPSQLAYEELFRRIIAEGVPAVLFCISSGISGGCGGAITALNRIHEQDPDTQTVPIYIMDTLLASTPLGLLVIEACRQRDAGRTAQEVAAWAEQAKWNIHTLFMVEDLDTLHRGGRVPKTVATIGGALDVKPLLSFDLVGQLAVTSVTRGRRKGMRKLAKNFSDHHDPAHLMVGIGDADCPEDGDRLSKMLRKSYPDAELIRTSIGPTIGSHVGPGMLSCCFWGQSRRRT